MTPIPAPTLHLPREEWADTDFDIPDGQDLNPSDAESDNDMDQDEDWDTEMRLGKTGGASMATSLLSITQPSASISPLTPTRLFIAQASPGEQADDEDEDDDEGASTIKVTSLPFIPSRATKTPPPPSSHKPQPPAPEEDLEDAFDLPADLSQLSLRPLSHRTSKTSIEWGDRDHTSSSTSSDAYSTLGFVGASPSSTSTSAPSTCELETDEENDDDPELEGLVFPSNIFGSTHSGKHLSKILDAKKREASLESRNKTETQAADEDFEMGLVIDDDLELSPSRLPINRGQSAAERKKGMARSKSVPTGAVRPATRSPPSSRAKSPTKPPSIRQRQQTLPPAVGSTSRGLVCRSSATQNLFSATSSSTTFLASPGPISLRAQKSHGVLKPPSPRSASSGYHLSRKASLSSLIDTTVPADSGSGLASPTYNAPTAASRARQHQTHGHFHSTTRLRTPDIEAYAVPPTRPSTPSSNPVALRLTMPTSSSRAKMRPAISSVFANTASLSSKEIRSTSPLPPRPSSTASSHGTSSTRRAGGVQPALQTVAPSKVLRRPKKSRHYGDGTELDGIEDLPTDRDKEVRYRVAPKGFGAPKAVKQKPSLGRGASRNDDSIKDFTKLSPSGGTLRHKSRTEFSQQYVEKSSSSHTKRKTKPSTLPQGATRRKPTLIRNLGGVGAPKVVGDMKWNPQSCRWEGNEHVLRDFDAVTSSSARPALITHLTGSSIGSPVGSFASGVRVVGNMMFDPARMCWISRLPPDEDEPDVFAGLADNEEEDGWEVKGGTIRASQQNLNLSTQTNLGDSPISSKSRPPSRARSDNESGSERPERGARPTLVNLVDVDGSLVESCRAAEDRHRVEMKGWKLPSSNDNEERSSLWEIRTLATRNY